MGSRLRTKPATQYALHRADIGHLAQTYLGPGGDPRDPYASPLHAKSHAGLPPAYLMPAEFDLLRDDVAAYAQNLRKSGVRAVPALQAGHIYPSSGFTKILPAARAWRDEAITTLHAVNTGNIDQVFSGKRERVSPGN